MKTYIVGVDCATEQVNIGVALAEIDGAVCTVIEAHRCSEQQKAVDTIVLWCKEYVISLLALDAPLGWPCALGAALAKHRAGEPTGETSDHLFSRETNRAIENRLEKKPLEVGANLIARTANSALDFLAELRSKMGQEIALAWEIDPKTKKPVITQLSAIEVYPAATWLTLRSPIPTINGDTKGVKRHQLILDGILDGLTGLAHLSVEAKQAAQKSGHVLDAILCVIAAKEFINGQCVPPTDQQKSLA